jgi:hypothetical protein
MPRSPDARNKTTKAQWRSRMDRLGYRFIWSFLSDKDVSDVDGDTRTYSSDRLKYWFVCIRLNLRLFNELKTRGITVSESCISYVYLAIVVCMHEHPIKMGALC